MRKFTGLFRGKRTDNGEGWIEGFYMCLGNKYHYILAGKIDLTQGYPDLIKFPVDPDTVGECTGLADKNGKLIFEGHTINSGGTLYEIRMDCGEWRMFDKAGYYCELYIYAEESEIVSED